MLIGTSGAVVRDDGDTRPLRELYRDAVRRAQEDEQAGFDFSWHASHHFAWNQWCPSLLPLLANIAAQTSSLRLGTNLLVMAYYNPVRLAEDIATVDLLTDGRLDCVVGSGSVKEEFETFGIDPQERWGRMYEGLGIVRRALSNERFDHEGKYFTFKNVEMTTEPMQKPFPLWVAGQGPKTAGRAGREGYHLQAGAALHHRPALEAYREGRREAGLDPEAHNLNASVQLHVASTSSKSDPAWDRAEQAYIAWRAFYRKLTWIAFPKPEDAELYIPVLKPGQLREVPLSPSLPVVGTPDEILKILEPQVKNSAITHLQIGNGDRNSMSGDETATQLFSKEVMPVLRSWGRQPV